jgi:hypothetical protein
VRGTGTTGGPGAFSAGKADPDEPGQPRGRGQSGEIEMPLLLWLLGVPGIIVILLWITGVIGF